MISYETKVNFRSRFGDHRKSKHHIFISGESVALCGYEGKAFSVEKPPSRDTRCGACFVDFIVKPSKAGIKVLKRE